MAREHARVKLSIWEDDNYRDLSVGAQHLYYVLLIHPQLSYAGVADWRSAKLSGFARGWTAEDVELAAKELSEKRYVVVDEHTEEVLIRSFIRNDGLLDSPNMAVAVRKAHAAISSQTLRGVVVFELVRLRADKPDLRGWPNVEEMLSKASVNPSEIPSFNPSVNPSRNPSGTASGSPSGNGDPIPSGSPSVIPSPTTAPSPAPPPSSQMLAPQNGARGQRATDELFEAVVAECGIDAQSLTPAGRGPLNGALKQLRDVEATPTQVRLRARRYREKFPRADLTPSALVKHWASLTQSSTSGRDIDPATGKVKGAGWEFGM